MKQYKNKGFLISQGKAKNTLISKIDDLDDDDFLILVDDIVKKSSIPLFYQGYIISMVMVLDDMDLSISEIRERVISFIREVEW